MKTIVPYTSEHEMYRNALTGFMEKEIMPHYNDWSNAGEFPKEIYAKLGENGYLCTWADEQYGGVNGDFLYEYILADEVTYRGGNSLNISLHSGIAAPYLDSYANPEQKEKWLTGVAGGKLLTSIAMTEPGAGSDIMAMRSRAQKDGNNYILNGSKTFISNGVYCDLAIVAFKTDPNAKGGGISLFVVEDGTPGFSKGKAIPKIGAHASGTNELFFEDCVVPAENMLGKEGKGFYYLMEKLQQERVITCAVNVAMAQRSLELTIDYVKERQLFGKKLSQFQNTQFVLAEIASEIEIGRRFMDQLAVAHNNKENIIKEVSMAKYWLAEMNFRTANRCLQLFGGYGYCEEYDISKQFCDSRSMSIVAGASEVMKVLIARELGL